MHGDSDFNGSVHFSATEVLAAVKHGTGAAGGRMGKLGLGGEGQEVCVHGEVGVVQKDLTGDIWTEFQRA